MTLNRQTEKWITAGLGVVALILIVNLVYRGGGEAPAPRGATPARGAAPPAQGKSTPRVPEELARYDPALQLDKLKAIQDRPEAKLKRNPFEFVQREVAVAPEVASSAPAPAPQAPAPPPPPPLKAVGYTQLREGGGEAIVTLQDELFIVHEGESFAKRFRVQKLTPAVVEVFDETTQQIIRLPIGG